MAEFSEVDISLKEFAFGLAVHCLVKLYKAFPIALSDSNSTLDPFAILQSNFRSTTLPEPPPPIHSNISTFFNTQPPKEKPIRHSKKGTEEHKAEMQRRAMKRFRG
ncbi:MAG: hypothetical protein ABI370_06275 [Gammaproteobacteria bacterium]